ncbi:unnamed protein product, partial [Mesorhabditis spiculigera]
MPSSNSSTDSEPNNNVPAIAKSNSVSSADHEVLQVAQRIVAPIKQRKISRAASASRIRHRRGITGLTGMGKGESFKEANKEAVQHSWSALLGTSGDMTVVGLGIYQKIFDAAPEMKAVFSVPEHVHDLQTFTNFHRSGKLFVSVIDLCVRSIDSLDSDMGPILNIPDDEKGEDATAGWNFVIRYICGKLGEGFQLERMRTANIRRKSVL